MKNRFYISTYCFMIAVFLTACSSGSGNAVLQDSLETENQNIALNIDDSSDPEEGNDTKPDCQTNIWTGNDTIGNVIKGIEEYWQYQADMETAEKKQELNKTSWYGSWEIKDCQTADSYALSQEEINGYLTYQLSYYDDSCQVNGIPVDNAVFNYEVGEDTETSILANYHADLGEWWNGIENVTSVSVISSENFFGCHFFCVDVDTLWIYHEGVFFLAKRTAAFSEPDLYAGRYYDYDADESNLFIQKNDDGTYTIQIGIFRLVYMDDGVGYITDNGMEFSATAPNGKKISGTISLEGDIATVTFTGSDWSEYSSINEYQYHKISDLGR